MKNILYYLIAIAAHAHLNAYEIRLINGTPAGKDWAASINVTIENSSCTATLIGERTLLLTAHCVLDGKPILFSVKGVSYQATCSRSPQYKSNPTVDLALCFSDKKVDGIPYEIVNQDPNTLSVGQELQLTGYGCTKEGGGGGNDGVYRIGTSKITQLPSGNSNDIITVGGNAVCFKDTGAPAFLWDSKKEKRLLVGVNSRGDMKTKSYLSSVSSSFGSSFLKDWASKNNTEICGVHNTAKGCRSSCQAPIAYAGKDITLRKGEWAYIGGMPSHGVTYQWTPATDLDDPTSSMPIASPTQTTIYTLKVTNSCTFAEQKIKITVLN